ncbi:unnamed protein product [Aureobasidium uvarum]|uniref:BTB domain-containing protein n=1 Tax=Aureobasidium uvarum TaxID=2773716 RepID=A0A9N8KXE8_9PEZI|nr:unnamed protein product [Aureobasidium uvarum]
MEDEDFINGEVTDPTVFDNPKDSDIILTFSGHQIYAHRVILRMWSPFFKRVLDSQFCVANNATFNIDDECDDEHDPEPVYAMLKHIYGIPFVPRSSTDPRGVSGLKFCIKLYMMTDKYDIPSVRRIAVSVIQDHLFTSQNELFGLTTLEPIPRYIALICGPRAPQLADPELRDVLFSWLTENFCVLTEHQEYRDKIEDGSLLDSELTAKLLFSFSAQISANKKTKTTRTTYLPPSSPTSNS